MKKVLLFAAAVSLAASAMAEVFPAAAPVNGEDITPAGYKFNTYGKDFIGYSIAEGLLNWNMSVNWYKDHYVVPDKSIEDGLILVTGPVYNNNAENTAKLEAATKIIDLGGTCGKVLCINFAGSTFPQQYKSVTGNDLEIGEVPGSFPLLFWHFDHKLVQKYVGQKKDDADYMPLRLRIEMSLYANSQSSQGEYWKAYVNDDQNNVRPAGKDDNTAPDILVNPAEFAYRWCEKSDDPQDAEDDAIWDEGPNAGAGEWNPTRWLVYEWDLNVADIENEGDPFQTNIRIKNEIPGGNLGNFAILIRNIELYVPEDVNREYVYAKRLRTWNTYTVGEDSGIKAVDAESDCTFNVSGNTVNFSAPAQVYTLAGTLAAEGTNVTLSKGLYVAKCGTKAVKVLVK